MMTNRWILILGIWMVWNAGIQPSLGQPTATDRYAARRHDMVEKRIATAGVTDERVLESIRNTPRHEFVPEAQLRRAYFDMALPIGDAQTISSPFIVALMTQALEPKETDNVLEIGTGSGYQAAVLSPLVAKVYTIEIVDELGRRAARTIQRLGYENVKTRIGDGFLGWPDAAPFDKIIVTCSPESVPKPLVEQLREGGQMIIPVGERYQQTLYRLIKQDGELVRQPLRPTLFVPMTGEAEDARKVKPNAAQPVVVNGDFEDDSVAAAVPSPSRSDKARVDQASEFVAGWYYGRQVRRVKASTANGEAASGTAFVRCENKTPGLSSHLLQGIPIDGRQVSTIRLSGSVRTSDVKAGGDSDAVPMIAISFYDEERRDLGTQSIGPFNSTRPWREKSKLIRVPFLTREAILRVGLFGATGQADFDNISIRKVN